MPKTQYRTIGVMSMTRFEQSEKRKPEIVKNFQTLNTGGGRIVVL